AIRQFPPPHVCSTSSPGAHAHSARDVTDSSIPSPDTRKHHTRGYRHQAIRTRQGAMKMRPEAKTVLVTGATGAQGGAVAHALHNAGHHVRVVTRNPQSGPARAHGSPGHPVVTGEFDHPQPIS